MFSPKVAIIIYTVNGHISKLAEAIKQGITEAGGAVTIYKIPGTTATTYPTITPEELINFDAFLFGVPTRVGSFPAEWKIFWDATGKFWKKCALAGKFAGVFVSTGSPGGGQEATIMNSLSTFTHHGIIYVPLGYARTLDLLTNVEEVHGGSPWGAGTFAGFDDKREVTALELNVAKQQGIGFWEVVSKHKF